MKKIILALFVCATLTGARVFAQEPKHEEHKEEKKAQGKTDGMKCCEGMEKKGEKKEGTEGDMKAKIEKMKAMKEKMAEKMKDIEETKMKATKGDAKPSEPSKDEHQH